MFPFVNSYFYYAEIALQGLCVFHCIRKGNQNKWIYIIVFLPVIGSVAYFFSEILPGLKRSRGPQINIGAVINPGGQIKKLEEKVRFADTFNNRMELADAYLAGGMTDKAIGLYESSLTGAFAENEHGIMQLATAYYAKEHYEDVIKTAKKVYRTHQFARSPVHLLYAKALEFSGQPELAESEFKLMKGRYFNFEQRYEYGMFLERADRVEEAAALFEQMLEEAPHLSGMERRNARVWFSKAKDELKKLYA